MLWAPSARKVHIKCLTSSLTSSPMTQTRSGAIFAAWTGEVSAIQSPAFDIAPLLLEALTAERDDQEDSEPDDALNDIDDALNGIDDVWPLLPRPDPWNEVDDLPPAPEQCASPNRKRC